jgi:hypothetical protein
VFTNHQVLALWKEFSKSKVVKISALKAGMDRKTATTYINSKTLPSEVIRDRNWKNHPDKLDAMWPKAEGFLKENSYIEAKALFEHLLEAYASDIEENQLRTFQRRIKQWKIKYGVDQEVYFDQFTTQGKLAQLDWLVMNSMGIQIAGEHFQHKLCHFTLNHSNVESVSICRSDSILSIKKGLREFLYRVLGKAPQILQVIIALLLPTDLLRIKKIEYSMMSIFKYWTTMELKRKRPTWPVQMKMVSLNL